MDLSFEGENNFYLPDPSGKLDFTEDEERKNEQSNQECNLECNQQAESNDQMMDDNQEMANDSEIDDLNVDNSNVDSNFDGSNVDESNAVRSPELDEAQFNKPIINQNLMLNRNSKMMYNKTGLQEPVTPALIKRKQLKPWFNSPTDSCLSPCTQKLFKNKKPI